MKTPFILFVACSALFFTIGNSQTVQARPDWEPLGLEGDWHNFTPSNADIKKAKSHFKKHCPTPNSFEARYMDPSCLYLQSEIQEAEQNYRPAYDNITTNKDQREPPPIQDDVQSSNVNNPGTAPPPPDGFVDWDGPDDSASEDWGDQPESNGAQPDNSHYTQNPHQGNTNNSSNASLTPGNQTLKHLAPNNTRHGDGNNQLPSENQPHVRDEYGQLPTENPGTEFLNPDNPGPEFFNPDNPDSFGNSKNGETSFGYPDDTSSSPQNENEDQPQGFDYPAYENYFNEQNQYDEPLEEFSQSIFGDPIEDDYLEADPSIFADQQDSDEIPSTPLENHTTRLENTNTQPQERTQEPSNESQSVPWGQLFKTATDVMIINQQVKQAKAQQKAANQTTLSNDDVWIGKCGVDQEGNTNCAKPPTPPNQAPQPAPSTSRSIRPCTIANGNWCN
jgi:hypothetical protein